MLWKEAPNVAVLLRADNNPQCNYYSPAFVTDNRLEVTLIPAVFSSVVPFFLVHVPQKYPLFVPDNPIS